MDPRSNSTNLQKGSESVVYSSFKYCFSSSSPASSSRTFSLHGHIQITGIFLSRIRPCSSTRERRTTIRGTRPLQRSWASPRLAPRRRAGCGNLSPSRSVVTEFKEILPKYKDPDSGRSLGVSPSQYPPARSA